MKPLNPFDITFSGINLIEASAGTGKTYNIASLYIRALIERDISISQILVVTYTEAATKELKDRLLERIRESIRILKMSSGEEGNDQFISELFRHVQDRSRAIMRLQKAVQSFDEAAIYTIHGFCYHALQEQAFESRSMFDTEMIGDDSELVQEAVDDYWRKWVDEMTANPLKIPLLKLISDKGYTPETLAHKLDPFIGKPYLQILPESVDDCQPDQQLYDLREHFLELKSIWNNKREEIFKLLDAGQLSYYRTDWLEGWMQQMQRFLEAKAPPIELFDKFEKFTQSFINDNLKKSSMEKGETAPQHKFFEHADEYQNIAQSLQAYEVIFLKNFFLYLRDELKQKKEGLRVLSYDDLLLQLCDALGSGARGQTLAKKLRSKYPLALVDEFQDTDPNQYEIFQRIYQSGSHDTALFMIGDPKQSIYSFRGADVFSYLEAKADAPTEKTFNLDRNFRSVPALIESINTFFGEHPNPFILNSIFYKAVSPGKNRNDYESLNDYGKKWPPMRFRILDREHEDQFTKIVAKKEAAKDTAAEIQRLIEGGNQAEVTIGSMPVRAKDIAVLVRTHKQADLVSQALQQRGMKSVQYSQQSVFNSEEARQVEIFLKAVAQPGNETLIRSALALPLTEYRAEDLLNMTEDKKRWIQILDQFRTWYQRWQDRGFSSMFYSVLREAGISEHLIRHTNGERKLTNVLHLAELLQAEERRGERESRGLLKWLAQKRQQAVKKQDEEQLRLESDEDLVKIVTMHRSKGLEYSIVFCPFLWHGPELQDRGNPLVFHDAEDTDIAYLDFNGKLDSGRKRKFYLAAREELAESLRLAYVAITRAKQCCYLTWAYANKSELSPMAYLLSPKPTLELLKQSVFETYSAVGSEQIVKAIQTLCDAYPKLFSMNVVGQSRSHSYKPIRDNRPQKLACRTFHRSTSLVTSYSISSFSSLTSWMDEDPDIPDYDQFLSYSLQPETEEQVIPSKTMFTFPKGPQPGTCIHKIFEEIDFKENKNREEIISESLSLYGIDNKWITVVDDMIHTVVNTSLLKADSGLKMSALNKRDMVREMEFYYKNDEIKAQKLISIIREGHPHSAVRTKAKPGFLKGFIDLTFRFGEKYYLLDYKTNYLGDAVSDYRQHQLEEEIYEASYDLQYHLYAIALHRFLERKITDYSYDRHFGGAFYLFLRGMNHQGREGIFYDRPDLATIQKMNHYLKGGDHG